jgi:hypothetical protein
VAGLRGDWVAEVVEVDIPATVKPEEWRFGWEAECIMVWFMANAVVAVVKVRLAVKGVISHTRV